MFDVPNFVIRSIFVLRESTSIWQWSIIQLVLLISFYESWPFTIYHVRAMFFLVLVFILCIYICTALGITRNNQLTLSNVELVTWFCRMHMSSKKLGNLTSPICFFCTWIELRAKYICRSLDLILCWHWFNYSFFCCYKPSASSQLAHAWHSN